MLTREYNYYAPTVNKCVYAEIYCKENILAICCKENILALL